MGVVNCNSTWKSPFFPSWWLQIYPKPKKHWLGLAVIEQPQIQQRTSALPNPFSTMCLFSPAVETKNTGFWNNWRVSECVMIWRYIASTPKKRTQKNPQMKKCLCACMHTYSIYVLKHTNTLMCLLGRCALTVASLHGCMCVYIHSDNWLKPCSTNGIVMTSARVTRSDAIGSSITWNSTWLLVLKWPACLPTCQRMATGQSHFQQINLIWKFSSPCNLKQQQQGSDSLPILNSFFFTFPPSVLTQKKKLLNERGTGGTEGWMSVRREGGRERGMAGGRLVIISKGHSVNDYLLG